MHMEEPCFDFLRTKETLGWVASFIPFKAPGGKTSWRGGLPGGKTSRRSQVVLLLRRYQVYSSCRNTSGLLGFSVTVETQATKFR